MQNNDLHDAYWEDLLNEHTYMRKNGMKHDPEMGGFVCVKHRMTTVERTDGSSITYCQNCNHVAQ